jgi:hypothetical protein
MTWHLLQADLKELSMSCYETSIKGRGRAPELIVNNASTRLTVASLRQQGTCKMFSGFQHSNASVHKFLFHINFY